MIRRERGFALVLTLALLALLVVAVFALSALVRVNAQVASASSAQLQARQNAQLALALAVGQLQRFAGPDDRATGIAGVIGIAPGAAASTRHWCGVWRSDGSFVGWLVSGAQSTNAALASAASGIELVSTAAVGAAAANSEPVIAGKLDIPDANGVVTGRYAWLVIDEGVKTAAYAPSPVGMAPVVFSNSTTNAQARLRDALVTYASALPKVGSYEQLAFLPSPASALPPSALQDNFHHASLTPRWVVGNELRAGFTNVNTNSAIVWRNLLQTYNASPSAPAPISAATLSMRGTALQNAIAPFSATGKVGGGPFTNVAGVSELLAAVFTTGKPTAAQIYAVLAPQLAIRSDTFRVRAYGEAVNAVDPARVEGRAYCEAILQRLPEAAPGGLGRRFAIVSFRWLGPGDL